MRLPSWPRNRGGDPSRGWRYRRSLTSRVVLLTTFTVGVSVALVALATYFVVRQQLESSLDDSLARRAETVSHYDLSEYPVQDVPSWLTDGTDTTIGFINTRGQTATTKGPNRDVINLGKPEIDVARGERKFSCRTVTSSGADYRVAARPGVNPGVAVVVAQSLEPTERTLGKLGLVMLLFGVLGMLVAGVAGWGVARNGLRPVRRLTAATEEIARTERLDAIEVEGNDEIARLATAFNAMLAALSTSRDRQRQLIADAGHELRTPLTSLRTNLDLLTQADREGGLSEASRAELLDDVRFQIEELTTLIGDLTELARDQPSQVLLEEVDLAEILARAVQRVRRRASSLDFELDSSSWWLTGDAASLERAMTNLLDNAAKWSPPLGKVTVQLQAGTLLVADQGHGIAEADLPHVFDRFYRSPEARTMPGSGLGLSIVRQIAERHGGSVRAGRSADGGAAFWLRLPGSAMSSEAPDGTVTGSGSGPGTGTGSGRGRTQVTDRSQGSLSHG